jgi:septum formation protein
MRTIILASASPRRKELLEQAGLKFEIYPSEFNEIIGKKLSPTLLAERLSLEKAKAVAPKHKNYLIIAADTFVVLGTQIIGKPTDENDAKRILGLLSGNTHDVITGFTIYDTKNNKYITKSEKSSVIFNKLSEKEIEDYVVSKKPLDKAGAYGLQELPSNFIKEIKGDYDNIIGLPVSSLMEELKKLGVK